MKILIYGEYFLPVVGGVQTAMNLLAKGLAEIDSAEENRSSRNNEVTLVTQSAAGNMDDSTFSFRVIRRPTFGQLVRLIRASDVIHVAGPCLLPMAIAKLTGKPVVVEHHGYQAICPNGLLFEEPAKTVCPGYFAQRRYQKCVSCTSSTMGFVTGLRTVLLTFPRRWLCKQVAANITISDHVATRIDVPRTRTIYYGIEPLPDMGAAAGPETAAANNCLQMAYVGRLVAEKGPSVLLEAAKILQDDGVCFHLSYIGDGPERARLEQMADSFQLRKSTSFAGSLSGAEFEEAVAKVDLVVMPSLCEETAGLSAIEQMMRGRAVIVSEIGGLSEVVGDAGLKFPPGNAQELATRIRAVIADPAMARSLGAAGRNRAVRLFKQDCMIRNHFALYQEVARP